LSSVAEDSEWSEKLHDEQQPTTPSTIGCCSPYCATPGGSLEHEESEFVEYSINGSFPGKPSNPPSVIAVSARTVSPEIGFKSPTRESLAESDFLKPVDSETVNHLIAGMAPSPKSSKQTVRDYGDLSQSFQNKMTHLMEREEEIKQEMKEETLTERLATCVLDHVPKSFQDKVTGIMECEEEMHFISFEQQEIQQPVSESLAISDEEAPGEEESSKPTNVALGLKDDAEAFSRAANVKNYMLERQRSSTSLPLTDDSSTHVEVSLIYGADEIYESSSHTGACAVSETGTSMGKPKKSMKNVNHANFTGRGLRHPSALSGKVHAHKGEESNSIVDGGGLCATNSHAGHLAVDELKHRRFVHLDDVEVSPPRLVPLDDVFEMSDIRGSWSLESDKVSEFTDFITVRSGNVSEFTDFITVRSGNEEEKSRAASSKGASSRGNTSGGNHSGGNHSRGNLSRGNTSTETVFSKDVQHMLSDLGATFAKVGSELSQRFSCSDSVPDPDAETTIGMEWLSPCHGDIDPMDADDYSDFGYSLGNDSMTLSDYGSTQDNDSRTMNSRTISLNSSVTRLSFLKSYGS
jgi:hypothetical protein